MIRSIKFSQTEKVLAGALSIVALSAGVVIADQQPAGQTMAIESAADNSQIDGVMVSSNPVPIVDGVLAAQTTTTNTANEQQNSNSENEVADIVVDSASHQGVGEVTEQVTVTVDGKEVAPDAFGDNDVTVTTESTDTLDDSNNGTDVNVDRSVDQNTSTRNRVRNDSDINTNIGHNNVSGNKNPVTVKNGTVNINFSLPR